MKPVYKNTVFEHSRTEASGQFTIRADGKAFRLLIDGIYSDKITSCVRELCTNAFDSHAVAKQKRAFYVHLPTHVKAEFYVRDYGIGMDHGKVMDLYSTLFGSDKTGDNTQAGMFGLGSKTPFAYTDQFHVTCYDGKYARLYIAGIGGSGVPEIHLMTTDESDEPRGVKVGFAVNDRDFREFTKAGEQIAMGFTDAFDCNLKFSNNLPAPALTGKGWKSYNNAAFLPSQFMARQGCVLYPIVSHSGLSLPSDHYARHYILDCPIGTLEVTTARESLAYTAPVVDYLNKRFESLKEESRDRVWEEIKDIENVASFFRKIDAVSPHFVVKDFVHPLTKLTSSTYRMESPSCRYVVNKGYDNRWSYTVHSEFNAEAKTVRMTIPDALGSAPSLPKVYEIDDIKAFLDNDRTAETGAFTANENRRIARHIRRWMEANKLEKAVFHLAVEETDAFWEAVIPNVERVKLTAAEILSLIPPKREKPKPLTYIRGLSLTIKGSDQVVVDKINPLMEAVWVPADLYRQKGDSLNALARRFKIDNIFVASASAVKKVEEAKIPTLQAKIEEILIRDHAPTWGQWMDYIQMTKSDLHRLREITGFMNRVREKDKAQLDKLMKSKCIVGTIIKHILPFAENGLASIKENEYAGIKALVGDTRRKYGPEMEEVHSVSNKLAANSRNPAVRFLGELNYVLDADDIKNTVHALILLFRTIPLS